MSNAQINARFFAAIDAKTKAQVLENIATHYEISPEEAFSEVTDKESEHLLDYLTEPVRSATSALVNQPLAKARGFKTPRL